MMNWEKLAKAFEEFVPMKDEEIKNYTFDQLKEFHDRLFRLYNAVYAADEKILKMMRVKAYGK